jgi:acyl carrier protein
VNVHQQLEQVFRDVFNDDALILHHDMTSDDVPGWDSIAHINLMFAIEAAFGMQFVGNELAEARNIGEVEALVERRTAVSSNYTHYETR